MAAAALDDRPDHSPPRTISSTHKRSGTGSSAAWRSMCGAAEAKTAHPEKTRREHHLRSSRTFQRDRLSPSDADSSVSHCSEHTVASKNAANHPNVSTRIRSRGEVMWVIRPRSRTPNTRTSLRSVAGDPSARCRSARFPSAFVMDAYLVIGASLLADAGPTE
jgi:hypothetical protein